MDSEDFRRYLGYANTSAIFKEENSLGIENFELSHFRNSFNPNNSNYKSRRLGKFVERFVFYDLKRMQNVEIISENLQIQNEKTTIGELDCLLYLNSKPVHLEIVYKFYLYDKLYDKLNDYKSPLEYWIGPNRKDTLSYKLNKLKNKQYPLLHNTVTKSYLENYKLETKTIQQKLLFKAQLFLPYDIKKTISPLNENCINGYYISFKNFDTLENHQFYIPKKLDWLIIPHDDVHWISFEEAKSKISEFINKELSPMCWVKDENFIIKKCFVTYW